VDQARTIVKINADRWFAGRTTTYALDTPQLQWVEPSSAFGPGPTGAPARPYKLAWVTTIRPSGEAAGYVTLISVFVDAADGTIIGGDVVE
jgi:hypothetical protein